VPGWVYPDNLINPDDEILASVEHYLLTRGWVGNGVYPAWELRMLAGFYDLGKVFGMTPRYNPGKPVTPLSRMQIKFQMEGIADGERDLKKLGKSAPAIARPPKYW